MGKIKNLVIHCADTPASFDVDRKHIEKWHLEENGWSRVGYQLLVKRSGELQVLIPFDRTDNITIDELANGAKGFNSNSFHMCWAGGKGNEDNRTTEQTATMAAVVKMLVMLWPDIKVLGHQQINAYKYCPAFNVPRWMEEMEMDEKNIDFNNYENNASYQYFK